MFFAAEAKAAADCSLSSVGVAFGTYDLTAGAPNDSTGSVTVVCTHVSGGAQKVSYNLYLSTGGSGTYSQRQLRAGAGVLNYNLFANSARSSVWGNGAAGTTAPSGSFTVGPGVGNGRREVAYPVYGRIPALQDAQFGVYIDTIIVTLEF